VGEIANCREKSEAPTIYLCGAEVLGNYFVGVSEKWQLLFDAELINGVINGESEYSGNTQTEAHTYN